MTKKQKSLADRVLHEQELRKGLTTGSHSWFFHTYFGEYVKHPTAPFQREFFRITEDESMGLAVLTAFRGSAKSTIFTTSYPIWAILGRQQRKFVVIISQTQPQARLHLSNLKRELESNRVLRADLGPFEEWNEEWSSGSLVLPKYNARITALSLEQGIRGLRHGAHRPDLIICDDLEDVGSVRTKESRDKTYQWFLGDVVPAGDMDTKTIVIGNLLHEDSLMMRLKDQIEAGALAGSFFEYPLLDADGKPLWPGKFRSEADVDALKKRVGNEIVWHREYLLQILSDVERPVHPEWIKFYKELPKKSEKISEIGIFSGVDLAASQKTSADYTAIVTVASYSINGKTHLYVLPDPVNERLVFPDTCRRLHVIFEHLHKGKERNTIFVESVGTQQFLVQQLTEEKLPTEGIALGGMDKRSRIVLTTPYMREGRILFPETGCEELIAQLVGFGKERHDDLADAFTLVANKAITMKRHTVDIWVLDTEPPQRRPFRSVSQLFERW